MKLKLYRIFYTFFLIICTLISIGFFSYTVYSIANGLNDKSDNVILIICYAVLLIFNIFQVFSLIRSFKHGSIFYRNIIETQDKKLNKNLLIIINIVLALVIFVLVYTILLSCGLKLPLSDLALANDFLIISFMCCAIVNIVFLDLYSLVYHNEE